MLCSWRGLGSARAALLPACIYHPPSPPVKSPEGERGRENKIKVGKNTHIVLERVRPVGLRVGSAEKGKNKFFVF